jgi:chromosome partitioning protein
MPVICLLNQKGGVGKTSTCHHLAGTLVRDQKTVLLVDNDPQSSLTQGFWGPMATREIDPAETVAAILGNEEPYPAAVIKPTGIARIDLVPGSKRATSLNVPDPHLVDPARQFALKQFLDEVKDAYTYVLIDCPPNLHLCSWSALVASDYLIVPLKPEDYGAQGIIDVQESVAMVAAGPNPSLDLLGYLLTMVAPRRTLHQLYEERLRAAYGDAVFRARVPEAVDFAEAIARRLPIAQYKPKGAPARAIKALAEEVLERIQARGTTTRTEAA